MADGVVKKNSGESGRTPGERLKEDPLPIYNHYNTTGHTATADNFSIEGREEQSFA